VTIDVTSVESGTADRDNHLRSPDFFDVENYAQMTFHSTGVEATGDGYQMTGDITIRDVARPVVLDFEFNGGLIDPYGTARVAFSASFEADREDWGLTWNMPLETGGFLVGKKIKVSIDTEAVKAS
jgi:polyisoprenoid-binding protein YceI